MTKYNPYANWINWLEDMIPFYFKCVEDKLPTLQVLASKIRFMFLIIFGSYFVLFGMVVSWSLHDWDVRVETWSGTHNPIGIRQLAMTKLKF